MDALVKDAARLPLGECKGFRGRGEQSWQAVLNGPPSGFCFSDSGFCTQSNFFWKRFYQ